MDLISYVPLVVPTCVHGPLSSPLDGWTRRHSTPPTRPTSPGSAGESPTRFGFVLDLTETVYRTLLPSHTYFRSSPSLGR